MPKIEIEVRNVGSTETWKEKYDCSSENPLEWAKKLIGGFNATLRSNEKPREVVGVEVLDDSATVIEASHSWTKQNLVTIIRGSKMYDIVSCEKCGITGKRFGLGGVTHDAKFKAKKYNECKS